MDFKLIIPNLIELVNSVYQWRDDDNRRGQRIYDMLTNIDAKLAYEEFLKDKRNGHN